jgi:long-chain acyl-CoA synthetase
MSNLWELTNIKPETDIVVPGETMPAIFWNAAKKRGPNTWLRQKKFGIWQTWTWNQAAQIVKDIANGLIALGFNPQETASVLSNTKAEWVFVDLAILSAGGVSNGIYPTDSSDQVQYLCEDSTTTILFVEDDEQLDKALDARQRLPHLRKIVVEDLEGLRGFEDPQVISLEELQKIGRDYGAKNSDALDARLKGIGPEELAILIYTSGTTGKPKGGMHSHRGIISAMHGLNTLYPQYENDERMCFLPLCHVAERFWGEYFAVYTGTILNFVENPETVPENMQEIAPTVMTAVPRIWEKFYSSIMIAVKDATRLQQRTYQWSIGTGYKVADLVLVGKPVPSSLKAKFRIARVLTLDNIRRFIGIHRARYLNTGAAPISPELIRWYLALGIPMLEVWGMTETGAAMTAMPADGIRPGTIGRAASYAQVRLDPETKELQVRADSVFMGYLNLPEKTAEVFDEGRWLKTGDVGAVDEDGYFKIIDRMKDIIITAGGKNITPSELENELKFSPYIIDAVVIGDRRPFLTCIIMIDQENVEKFAQDNNVPFSNYASLTRAQEIKELIEEEVEKVNKKFARVEQIKKFWLLDVQLSAEDEELTPTMKLKRNLVEKKYAAQIEAMYFK